MKNDRLSLKGELGIPRKFFKIVGNSGMDSNVLTVILGLAVLSSILFSSDVFGLTVPVGTSPTGIGKDLLTNMIYVSNQGSNTVSVINGTTNNVTATIPVGTSPQGIAIDPSTNMIYVVNEGSNDVSVINGSSNTVVTTIAVGSSPFDPIFNPTTNLVYVPNAFSNTLSVINASTNTVITTIGVGTGPVVTGVDPIINKVYVTNLFSNTVSVINGTTNTVKTTIGVTGASGITVNSITHRAYVSNLFSNTVVVIDTTTDTVVGPTITVGNNPRQLATNPNTNQIFTTSQTTNSVSVINGTTNSVMATLPVGVSPVGITVDPATNTVYVTNSGSNDISIITVSNHNPPTANAGPDQVVNEGNLVTLNGTNSIGNGLTYKWTQILGPQVNLTNSTSPTPTFTAPLIDINTVLTFKLVVNDGTFDSVPDTVNIVDLDNTTFTIPLKPSAGTLLGNVTIPKIVNGSTVRLEFLTPSNTLSTGKLQENVIPVGKNATDVKVNVTEASTVPQSLPPLPEDAALFFDLGFQGIDFSNTSNFAKNRSPLSEFQVSSNFHTVKQFSDGCPVVDFLLFNETSNQWQQLGNPLEPNSNKIYVARTNTANVTVIDGNTNNVIKTITVGNNPRGLTVNPKTDLAYVANFGSGTVSVINGTTNNVTATIPTGIGPFGIKTNPVTNQIYVANFGSGTVSVINGTTNTVVSNIPVGNTLVGLDVNSVTNRIYVASFFTNNVAVINGATNTVIANITVNGGPSVVSVNPNTNRAYVTQFIVNTVSVIDTTTNTVIATVPVGSGPAGISVNPNTNLIYVTNTSSGTVSVIDGVTNTVIANIPVGTGPFRVDVNQNTNRIFVANGGSGTVSVIDGLSNKLIGTINVGAGSETIAVNPNVPNPVRDPSTDAKDSGTGKILQCSYIASHPHLSKFAVGGIITPVLALLGPGGSGSTSPSLGLSSLILSDILPENIKNEIENRDPNKPIQPSNDKSFDLPFSIEGNGFAISSYSNEVVTTTVPTDNSIPVGFAFYYPNKLVHVGLYFNVHGSTGELQDSDTYILYDEGQPLQIVDPHGFFGDVKISSNQVQFEDKFSYNITFKNPMTKSDLIVRAWDNDRRSADTKILDAIEVVKDTQAANPSVPSPEHPVSQLQGIDNEKILDAAKAWGGYSPTSIADSQLLSTIGLKGQHIPSWFMKTTKWLIDGETSQQDFVGALKYMSEDKIIK